MGVLFDYFAAGSDDAAASAIDVIGGLAEARPEPFVTVELKGIDPVVQMGTLEGLLTGVDYKTATSNPRAAHLLAELGDGEIAVVTLTDELRDALAAADDKRCDEIAVSWSRTEEFDSRADPADIAVVLRELASLARMALTQSGRLYCRVCV